MTIDCACDTINPGLGEQAGPAASGPQPLPLMADPSGQEPALSASTINVAAIFPRALRSLFGAVLPVLLPSAAYSCVNVSGAPASAGLLTGSVGSGKTTVLSFMAELLHHNLRTQTHISHINGAELKSRPLDFVLNQLAEAFTAAKAYPTSLILIDNVDVLCPSGKENGAGTLRDERGSVISLHLEMLIRETTRRNREFFGAAANLSRECDGEGEDGLPFGPDKITQLVLGPGATYVLATAQSSDSISPSLLAAGLFSTVTEIEGLTDRRKLVALETALGAFGATLGTPEGAQQEQLVTSLQGFCLRDMYTVAKRACFTALQRNTTSSTKRLEVTWQDVLEVARNHISISSGATASASAGSTVNSSGAELSLADIPGYHEARRVLVDTLRTPLIFARLYQQCPTKMPRSVLLYGPPGCGKTLLARAAGTEFGHGFISVRGPELLNKYIGASEAAVRALFQRARESNRPCLIFFDEFESLAPRRGKDNTGVTDRVVNQLLTFIDGVESTMATASGTGACEANEDDSDCDTDSGAGQIFIVAATSRPDLIDPALLRPGRIEKHIYVGLPNEADRVAILENTLESVSFDGVVPADVSVVVHEIAKHAKAATLSAADWKAVVNTAYLAAAHEHIDTLSQSAAPNRSSGVRIGAGHLRQAYHTTRASITGSDLLQLTDIYRKFGKHALPDAPNVVAEEAGSTDVDKAQKLSYY
jgi:SpoVK/Ycf46/Vps4 family AAA+-type ATPase